MNIETLTEFFGWCAVINIAVQILSLAAITLGRERVLKIHGKIFDLDEKSLKQVYLRYLSQYKVLTVVFTVVPYFALKIIG
jgi:hypothetical protein